jgi:prepilin signal peptidase PulO-like enzyme (type II secretory pathway)
MKLGYWLALLVAIYFGIIFVIDMEHRLILHPTSIFGFALALGVGLVSNGFMPTLWGGLGGFAIMLVLYYLGVLFSRIRAGRMRARGLEADDEEALGAGDVILAAILGLMLGWPLIWFGLLMGILLGGIFGALLVLFLLIVKRYKENVLMVFMPYGPFFVLSAFFIMFLPGIVALIVPK